MKIVFAGTPEVAVPSLQALVDAGLAPSLVLTRPDAPVGRKRILTPSAVGSRAAELGLPLIKTVWIGPQLQADHPELNFESFDLGVVVAYGGMIREPLLSAPKHGWVNLHFSDLPAYRGAAPVQRAILHGETSTALCIFELVSELDAGPVIAKQPTSLHPFETSDQALARLAVEGAPLLVSVVQQYQNGTATATAQQGEPSFAPKFSRNEGFLDWNQPAQLIDQRFRAVTSEPGAFSTVADSEIKIHALRLADQNTLPANLRLSAGELALDKNTLWIGTATEALELVEVQPAGKTRMNAADWWRGKASHG